MGVSEDGSGMDCMVRDGEGVAQILSNVDIDGTNLSVLLLAFIGCT
jgi:hypothetical protein